MLKKELPEHLKGCKHVRCPYAKYNCPFEGTKEQLSQHLEKCRYEGLKEYLQKTDDHVISLQQDLRRKDEEIEFLRSMLARLSEKLEALDKTTNLRLESLEEQQDRTHQQLGEAHQGIRFAIDEIHHVQAQLGVTGTMDSQHLYKCKGTFVGHEGPVWTLYVQGETVCTGSSDNTIKIWNTGDQFKCLRTLSGHDGIVLVLCIVRDRLYSGSEDKTIRVWNLSSGEAIDRIEADENPISSLAHYGDMVFSGSLKTIKVWDTQTHSLMRVLPEQNHWVRALVVQGKSLYSGAYKAIKIWSLDNLDCVREVQCPGGSVYSIVLTNKYLVCGTYEHCIGVSGDSPILQGQVGQPLLAESTTGRVV
jgi:E3 ubiquitin-protein ligase TRAF7